MKRYMVMAAICGCLLVGSLYPKLLLDHHVRLVDKNGKELVLEEEYRKDLPVKLEWGFLRLFSQAD